MARSTINVLLWTPRVLALATAAFISVFALDVFGEGYDLPHTLLALAMHLIPTAVVLVALAVAWRWRTAGGLLFIAAGVAYSVRSTPHLSWILVIVAPLILIGALFVLGNIVTRRSGAR